MTKRTLIPVCTREVLIYYMTPNCTGGISNYVSSFNRESRLLGHGSVTHSRTQFVFPVSNRRLGGGVFSYPNYIGNFTAFKICCQN